VNLEDLQTLIPLSERIELASQLRRHSWSSADIGVVFSIDADPVNSLVTSFVEKIRDRLVDASEDELIEIYLAISPVYRCRSDESAYLVRDNKQLEQAAIGILSTLMNPFFSIPTAYMNGVDEAQSLVLAVYPDLRSHLNDRDHFVNLRTSGSEIVGDGLIYRRSMLYCHQFLKQEFTGLPNVGFLLLLSKVMENQPCNDAYLAIDHLRLPMSQEHYREPMKKAHTYGPYFQRPDLDDPSVVGVTCYDRHVMLDLQPLLDPIDRIEVYWKFNADEGLKELEIEEVHSLSAIADANSEYVINRYVHAIRSITKHEFCHFDGAVKIYDKATYTERHSSRMPREPKSTGYVKMFRLDGSISDDKCLSLIEAYFQGNEMVREYLQGKDVTP
jgi:hypothetical protein